MSTPIEMAHTLIRAGVFDGYHATLETTHLEAEDGRGASITEANGMFATARNYGPRPRISHGNYKEALEHLSIG